MMNAAIIIVTLVAAQRLIEVAYASRNTRALLARGAIETGRGHYPLFIVLHAAWLIAILVLLPHPVAIRWWLLGVFVLLQAARLWVIASLGPFWTTRIVTLPNAPLVRKGPYRFVRHPNYLVVAGEILVLPLVFGETRVAIVFTILNAALVAWRIRVEEQSLMVRRNLPPNFPCGGAL
jgi:methyltransferase